MKAIPLVAWIAALVLAALPLGAQPRGEGAPHGSPAADPHAPAGQSGAAIAPSAEGAAGEAALPEPVPGDQHGGVAVPEAAGGHGEAAGAHDEAGGAHGEAGGAHGEAAGGELGAHEAEPLAVFLLRWALRFATFFLVFGTIFWLLRRILRDAVAGQKNAIREGLENAERARAEAEATLRELESRVAGLDAEIARIREQAVEDAKAERRQILERAEAEAKKILDDAKSQIAAQARASEAELRTLAARLSTERAREILAREITDRDRARLFEEAVAELAKGGRP